MIFYGAGTVLLLALYFFVNEEMLLPSRIVPSFRYSSFPLVEENIEQVEYIEDDEYAVHLFPSIVKSMETYIDMQSETGGEDKLAPSVDAVIPDLSKCKVHLIHTGDTLSMATIENHVSNPYYRTATGDEAESNSSSFVGRFQLFRRPFSDFIAPVSSAYQQEEKMEGVWSSYLSSPLYLDAPIIASDMSGDGRYFAFVTVVDISLDKNGLILQQYQMDMLLLDYPYVSKGHSLDSVQGVTDITILVRKPFPKQCSDIIPNIVDYSAFPLFESNAFTCMDVEFISVMYANKHDSVDFRSKDFVSISHSVVFNKTDLSEEDVTTVDVMKKLVSEGEFTVIMEEKDEVILFNLLVFEEQDQHDSHYVPYISQVKPDEQQERKIKFPLTTHDPSHYDRQTVQLHTLHTEGNATPMVMAIQHSIEMGNTDSIGISLYEYDDQANASSLSWSKKRVVISDMSSNIFRKKSDEDKQGYMQIGLSTNEEAMILVRAPYVLSMDSKTKKYAPIEIVNLQADTVFEHCVISNDGFLASIVSNWKEVIVLHSSGQEEDLFWHVLTEFMLPKGPFSSLKLVKAQMLHADRGEIGKDYFVTLLFQNGVVMTMYVDPLGSKNNGEDMQFFDDFYTDDFAYATDGDWMEDYILLGKL